MRISAGIRAGRQYGEYSLKTNKMKKKKENDPWELGFKSLVKKKNVISVYLRCMKGESPLSKFPECKQMINEALF